MGTRRQQGKNRQLKIIQPDCQNQTLGPEMMIQKKIVRKIVRCAQYDVAQQQLTIEH